MKFVVTVVVQAALLCAMAIPAAVGFICQLVVGGFVAGRRAAALTIERGMGRDY